jgi:hypothetical protein
MLWVHVLVIWLALGFVNDLFNGLANINALIDEAGD